MMSSVLPPRAQSSRSQWLTFALALAAPIAFTLPALAQAPAVRVGGIEVKGIPDDWTNHRVVFSDPGTEQQAISAGRHEQWQKIVNDPRYVLQQIRRSLPVQGPAAVDAAYRARAISEAAGSEGTASGQQDSIDMGQRFRGVNGPPLSRKKPVLGPALHNDWSVSMGTGTSGTADVFPAKFGFAQASNNTTAACSDYAVFPTTVAGSTTVPNIIAYDNLYAGTGTLDCTSADPSTFWQVSVHTGTATYGSVTTSPVLSIDGSEVAFIESIGTSAYLVVVLMPNAADATIDPVACATTTNVNNTSQGSSPVVWCKEFADTNNDTASSPFVNYATNTLYVGDSSGYLHTFTNIFHTYGTGAPQTNMTAPTEGTAVATGESNGFGGYYGLSSPVYDVSSGLVFVGDTEGYLHSVNSSGTVVNSSRLGHGNGITDAPIVDPSTSKVYAFVAEDESSTGCTGATHCNAVHQFTTTSSITGSAGNPAVVGTGTGASEFYAGAFDNTYYSGSGTTGNLYVCGNVGGTGATLYQIAMNAGFTGTITAKATITSATEACSPITEVDNTDDYLFLSVPANGNLTATGSNGCKGTGGAGACVYSFDLTTSTTVPVDGVSATGGTSGIIIDNIVNNTGASQIYYETLGATDAVQVSQGSL